MYQIFDRVRSRLRVQILKYLLKKNKIIFKSLPSVSGQWPHIENKGKIFIGSNCGFSSFRLRHNYTVKKNAKLVIGDGSFFNDGVNLCATKSIKVGNNTMIGDMAYIFDNDFHQLTPALQTKRAPVIIGNNVWIGANSMILAGAVIGDHSVIAAGSIVTGEIPPKCLAVGTPARVIKTLDIPDDWVRN